jgi:hypothetical protein
VQTAAELAGSLLARVFTFLEVWKVVEYMEYNALVNFFILSLRVINRMSILIYVLDFCENEFLYLQNCEINIDHLQARDCLTVFFSIKGLPLFLWLHVKELNEFEIILSLLKLLWVSHFQLVYQYLI